MTITETVRARLFLAASLTAIAWLWAGPALAQSAAAPAGAADATPNNEPRTIVAAQNSPDTGALPPTSAAAPSPTSAADGAETEIVVTAQGRTQRLQDVPVSVSVVSGEALARANLPNLEQLSLRMPNIKIAPTPGSDFVTIRGVGSSINVGFEQSVGTFVDGLYRGRSRSTRSALFDVDRVEILKGPQTTFFGNNTIAGAINIATRKPGSRLEENATGFYAPGTGEYVAEAGVSVPLTDNLAIRVAARLSGMDGYIHNATLRNDGPHLNDKIGRASLAWTPGSILETNARIDVGHMRDRDIFDSELIGCPPDPALGPPAGACARYLAANGGKVDNVLDRHSNANGSFLHYDFVEAELTNRIALGRNSLTLTTGFFHHHADLFNDVLPIPANQGGSVVGGVYSLPAENNERFRQFSQEVRFTSPADQTISYIVGAYYSHSKLNNEGLQGLFFNPFGAFSGGEYGPTTPVVTKFLNAETAETKSAFAALTIRPIRALRVNLGLRYTDVRKHVSRTPAVGTTSSVATYTTDATFIAGSSATQARLLPILGVDVGNFATPRRSDSKVLPTASVQYDIAPNVMAYASYAKGFKAGGYSQLGSSSEFGPEGVDAYEAGIKSSFLDRTITVNIAGFYSDYKDLQESTTVVLPSSVNIQVVANVAASRSKGVEVGLSARPITGLTLNADVAYLDARYTRYPNGPCTLQQAAGHPGCLQDLSGKRRAFAPKYGGNFGASYERSVGDTYRGSIGANVYFSSRYFQQPVADPILSQPGNAKIDARVAFGRQNGLWEIAVVGKNLTDRLTANYRQITSAANSIQAVADSPRSIGIQITLRN